MPDTPMKFIDYSFARVISVHIIVVDLLFTTIQSMKNMVTCLMMNPGQPLQSHKGIFSCGLIALGWNKTNRFLM